MVEASLRLPKARKPDSAFKYRTVLSDYRLTWHALECKTGRNAKYSQRTAYTSDERRRALKARNGWEPSYHDHMARCCLAKQARRSPRS